MNKVEFSDEGLVKDWNLSVRDLKILGSINLEYRLYVALQLCAMRLYGRFLLEINDVSPRVFNYVGRQLHLPPTLVVKKPERKSTRASHHEKILNYLDFTIFGKLEHANLSEWLKDQIKTGILIDDLLSKSESYLLEKKIRLPGHSILERVMAKISSDFYNELFEKTYAKISPELRKQIDLLLQVNEGEKSSFFARLKKYPPSATVYTLKEYLHLYSELCKTRINELEKLDIEEVFANSFFKQSLRFDARDIKRFESGKRYFIMVCFLLESRSRILDNLVKMHDQYITVVLRKAKNSYEKKQREIRKKHKKAVDTVLNLSPILIDLEEGKVLNKKDLWQAVDEAQYKEAIEDFKKYKLLSERGMGRYLLQKYSSMRKYFSLFVDLPFFQSDQNAQDTNDNDTLPIIKAIKIIRNLDNGKINKIPSDAPTSFIPRFLRPMLYDKKDNKKKINRNT